MAKAFGLEGDAWLRHANPWSGWTVINPKVFPPPPSLDHWASKAVLGETF